MLLMAILWCHPDLSVMLWCLICNDFSFAYMMILVENLGPQQADAAGSGHIKPTFTGMEPFKAYFFSYQENLQFHTESHHARLK